VAWHVLGHTILSKLLPQRRWFERQVFVFAIAFDGG
jgi:hypothetical protein